MITKLMLSANHGLREGADVTSGSDKVAGDHQHARKEAEGRLR